MAKYYYRKYEVENYNWYEKDGGFYYRRWIDRSGYYQDLRKGYSFSNLRGYYGTGREYAGSGGYRCSDNGNAVYKYEDGERKDNGRVYYKQYKMDAIVTQKQRRGDYIETIQAEDGIYPSNGIQDNFYYVKGEKVDTQPACTCVKKENFDALKDSIFKFKYNDDEKHNCLNFDVQILNEDNAVAFSIHVETNDTEYKTEYEFTVPNGNLQNGKNYTWYVRAYSSNLQGEYSQLSAFTTGAAPTVKITDPIENIYNFSDLTVKWNYSCTEKQLKANIQLLDVNNSILTNNTVYGEDTKYKILYNLKNNETYTIKITVTSTSDISTITTKTISIEYIPPEATKINILDNDNKIKLLLSNVDNNIVNDIYRDNIRIASAVKDTYTDYAVSVGKHVYKTVAKALNNTTTESKNTYATCYIKNSILSDTTNYNNFVKLIYNPNKSRNKKFDRILNKFAGRTKYVADFTEFIEQSININFTVNANTLDKLEQLINNKHILLFRDSRGKKMFCTVGSYNITDYTMLINMYTINLTLDEVDYSEVV